MEPKFSSAKELIGKNNPALAISMLKELVKDKNDVFLLESRLNSLEKLHLSGYLNFDEYRLELTKIYNALLAICDQNENAKTDNNSKVVTLQEGNYSEIKAALSKDKEILYALHDISRMDTVEQVVLPEFEFPNLISFDFAVLSVHLRAGQIADKVTFIKLFEVDCSFDFEKIKTSIDASQAILSKSPVSAFGTPAADGIMEILESREDYRLNLKVICFDRKMILVMGRRGATTKADLIEMKTFNALNGDLELLTYDGLCEKIGVDWMK